MSNIANNNEAKVATPAAAEPMVKVGTSYFRQLYLFAFATQPEVINHLRTQAIPEELKRANDIIREWRNLQAPLQELIADEAGIADTIAVTNVPASHTKRTSEILASDAVQKTFQLPTTIEMVEIDKLIAAQRTVNLEFVDKLQSTFPNSFTLDDLIELCLAPREKPPVQHLEIAPNIHSFSSESGDLRFLGGFLKELTPDDMKYLHGGGVPAAAIISFVGYGADAVNVYACGQRVVLGNGFHRVFALRAAGVTHIPVIVQHINNPALEFPLAVVGINRDYLLGHQRPVLMKDFFVNGFTTMLRVRNRMRVVTAQIQAGQHDVPS